MDNDATMSYLASNFPALLLTEGTNQNHGLIKSPFSSNWWLLHLVWISLRQLFAMHFQLKLTPWPLSLRAINKHLLRSNYAGLNSLHFWWNVEHRLLQLSATPRHRTGKLVLAGSFSPILAKVCDFLESQRIFIFVNWDACFIYRKSLRMTPRRDTLIKLPLSLHPHSG